MTDVLNTVHTGDDVTKAQTALPTTTDERAIALPSDWTLHDISKYLEYHPVPRGNMLTHSPQAFADFVETHQNKNAGETYIFIDEEDLSASALLGLVHCISVDKSGFRAELKAKRDPIAAAIHHQATRTFKQRDFAQFLDRFRERIEVSSIDGTKIETNKARAAVLDNAIISTSDHSRKVDNYGASSSISASVEMKSTENLPAKLLVHTPEYKHLPVFTSEYYVSYNTDNFSIELQHINKEEADAFCADEFKALLEEVLETSGTEAQIYFGSFNT